MTKNYIGLYMRLKDLDVRKVKITCAMTSSLIDLRSEHQLVFSLFDDWKMKGLKMAIIRLNTYQTYYVGVPINDQVYRQNFYV